MLLCLAMARGVFDRKRVEGGCLAPDHLPEPACCRHDEDPVFLCAN
jgi:hypothetical protein